MKEIDKNFVKRAFNSSAFEYDTYSGLQRKISEKMVDRLNLNGSKQKVLDIGMGTGNLAAVLKGKFPAISVYGCDIAINMILNARKKLHSCSNNRAFFSNADAEFLPYKNDSFDMVVSSFAYQWIDGFGDAMCEAARVLKKEGVFLLSVFGAKTFIELKQSWQKASLQEGYSLGEALNLHLSKAKIEQDLKHAGFMIGDLDDFDIIEYYRDIPELFRTIKGMGSKNASHKRNRTPAVRHVWKNMVLFYEQEYGSQEGIPATYQIITAYTKKKY